VLTISGSDAVFTFTRADRSEADTTLVVEYSDSLATGATWTAVTVGATSGTADFVAVNITENGSAADTVVVTIPRGDSPALFVRLRATRAP
jgi:cysteine synthase